MASELPQILPQTSFLTDEDIGNFAVIPEVEIPANSKSVWRREEKKPRPLKSKPGYATVYYCYRKRQAIKLDNGKYQIEYTKGGKYYVKI